LEKLVMQLASAFFSNRPATVSWRASDSAAFKPTAAIDRGCVKTPFHGSVFWNSGGLPMGRQAQAAIGKPPEIIVLADRGHEWRTGA
jgi:hypothetical protein